MSKQSLVWKMGADDNAPIEIHEPLSKVTEVPLISVAGSLDHGIGKTLDRALGLGLAPTETALDLLILAASVYRCDTRISREVEAQDNWTREIDVYLPVGDPVGWTAVTELLTRTLNFLTGDKWRFFFRPRQEGLAALVPPTEPAPNQPTSVCLFSGGLDSFIGAVDLLAAGEDPVFVRHSAPWDSGTNKYQKEALRVLGDGRQVRHLKSDVGFWKNGDNTPSENTERSRSFLFFAIAVLAASGTGRADQRICVPENGLMSLNVPLDRLRLGALSTRTTHPFYMANYNGLLAALRIPAQVFNPYQFKSKGQMVEECRNQPLLARGIEHTMSCASPKKYRTSGHAYGHCGHCFPCIIRQAALQNVNDPTPYIVDLHAQPLESNGAQGESVRSCQVAISRLNNDRRKARVLVHTPGPLRGTPDDLDNYAGVYLQGMQEIARLLDGVQTVPDAASAVH